MLDTRVRVRRDPDALISFRRGSNSLAPGFGRRRPEHPHHFSKWARESLQNRGRRRSRVPAPLLPAPAVRADAAAVEHWLISLERPHESDFRAARPLRPSTVSHKRADAVKLLRASDRDCDNDDHAPRNYLYLQSQSTPCLLGPSGSLGANARALSSGAHAHSISEKRARRRAGVASQRLRAEREPPPCVAMTHEPPPRVTMGKFWAPKYLEPYKPLESLYAVPTRVPASCKHPQAPPLPTASSAGRRSLLPLLSPLPAVHQAEPEDDAHGISFDRRSQQLLAPWGDDFGDPNDRGEMMLSRGLDRYLHSPGFGTADSLDRGG